MLDGLSCDVVTKPHAAALVAPEAEQRPALFIGAEDGRVVWRFSSLALADPPAPHVKSHLHFALGKAALLDQRELFPPAQAQRTMRYGLDSPLTGKERWAGESRPLNRSIGRYPLSRIFVACPEPAGFVADTVGAPMLDLRWSAAGPTAQDDGAQLEFHAELAFDPAPDRRWREPVLELEMPHESYANICAVLEAIG